jgi:hypothetical protein
MVVRILCGLLGTGACYAAFFMYEDEEGHWQNRVEVLWISISDKSKTAGVRSTSLFRKVAEVVTVGFDRLFGPRLISARLIGSSTAYSLALVLVLICLFELPDSGATLDNTSTSTRSLLLVAMAICVASAAVPTIYTPQWLVPITFVPLAFLLTYFWVDITLKSGANSIPENTVVLVLALVANVISCVAVTVVVRTLVRYIAESASVGRIALAIIAQFLSVFLLAVGPLALVGYLQSKGIDPRVLLLRTVKFSAGLSFFSALLCFSFAFVMFVVLFHRLVWPTLARFLYPLARYEIVRSRKALAAVGTAALLVAFGFEASALKSIFQLLGK